MVRRDGERRAVRASDVVVDDIVLLRRGDQVPVDGVVVECFGLEIDESLLTGEAEAVTKPVGVSVLSGSVVITGAGAFVATVVGDDAYARHLTSQAREFTLAGSELRAGTDALLRLITWAMVPTAGLLLWSQVVANESASSAVQGTVAGVSAMVPEGLVLLTSMAFAAGAIRLGRRRVLTRELAAIEGLARVDVLFVDKTGTLTEPGMRVVTVESLGIDVANAARALAALSHLDGDINPTMAASPTNFATCPDGLSSR